MAFFKLLNNMFFNFLLILINNHIFEQYDFIVIIYIFNKNNNVDFIIFYFIYLNKIK